MHANSTYQYNWMCGEETCYHCLQLRQWNERHLGQITASSDAYISRTKTENTCVNR